MKTKLLLLLALPVYSANTYATHLRGGEITYQMFSNLHCEAVATLYSKFDGVSQPADRNWITINWGDGTQDSVCRTGGPLNSSGCRDGFMVPGYPPTKVSLYKAAHLYSGYP